LCELFFRVAVVTGGNKGIGLEVCRQLASRGVAVILTARDEKKGTEAVATLRGSGLPDVQFHRLDVSNPTGTARLAEFIKEKFGRLDILVRSLFSRKNRIDLMRYGRSIAEPCEKSHTSTFHRGGVDRKRPLKMRQVDQIANNPQETKKKVKKKIERITQWLLAINLCRSGNFL
jgi:hypothetical protein